MKTIKTILTITVMCLFLACSSDDDGPTPGPEPTVQELVAETGKWYLDYLENEIMDDCYKTTYYEFDGDMVTEQWFYTDDASGDCLAGFSETNNIEWLSDTKFRVLDDDYPYEITIKSINETEMTADYYSIINDETKEMVLDKNPGEE
ncbi:lipocalin family protein [Galbibacter sp. EGI 63066]|uniref:lipocalin family protein n=1 Tax=Galbibacter sp. EGI 63066 TaxID=2993559 RepID=UPI002248783C|nr:lipocalin family protein [Galbibacter sp. EGI 63066]MCX2678931.1 lipocalin family protein [Galbibacter sp. EGI 63066]